MILQGTRRGSKKSRGTEGEKSGGQLAGTFLEMSYLHQAAALQPPPGTAFSQPGTVTVPAPQQLGRATASSRRAMDGGQEEKPPGPWAALDHAHRRGGSHGSWHVFQPVAHLPWELLYLLLETTGETAGGHWEEEVMSSCHLQHCSCRAGQSTRRAKYRWSQPKRALPAISLIAN